GCLLRLSSRSSVLLTHDLSANRYSPRSSWGPVFRFMRYPALVAAWSSTPLVRGWTGRDLLTRVAAAVAGGGLGGRCRLRETRTSIRWVSHGRYRGPAVLDLVCVGGRREPDSANSGQGQGGSK